MLVFRSVIPAADRKSVPPAQFGSWETYPNSPSRRMCCFHDLRNVTRLTVRSSVSPALSRSMGISLFGLTIGRQSLTATTGEGKTLNCQIPDKQACQHVQHREHRSRHSSHTSGSCVILFWSQTPWLAPSVPKRRLRVLTTKVIFHSCIISK